MSNSRAARRRLAVSRNAIVRRRRNRKAGRWPFGGPSLSSVRRWCKQAEAAGYLTHTVERTGKPGRPPWVWHLTEAGEQRAKRRRAEGAPSPRHVEGVYRILKRAKGKPMTEDEIIAAYKDAMAPAEEAGRELAGAQ